MKKFLALVTIVCMVLTSTAAFALTFPSKTAQDMTTIRQEYEKEEEKDGWYIYVTEPNELIEKMVTLMAEHAEEDPIVTFFAEEVLEQILEFKPDDVENIHDLVVYELVPVACEGYDPEFGEAYAYFTFATAFEEGSEVVVKLDLPRDDVEEQIKAFLEDEENEEHHHLIDWTVQKCVVENGEICIKFVKEQLVKMEEKIPALVIVLSAEIEPTAEEK